MQPTCEPPAAALASLDVQYAEKSKHTKTDATFMSPQTRAQTHGQTLHVHAHVQSQRHIPPPASEGAHIHAHVGEQDPQ